MGYKMKGPSMAIKYGGESVQQHRANLMKDNPVAKHASKGPAEVVTTPKTRREEKGKKERLKSFEGETSAQAKTRRGKNKQNRKDARRQKTADKIKTAKNATKGKKSNESKEVIIQANKAKRLAKRLKRQEGRADRKKIRSGEKQEKKNVGLGNRNLTKKEMIKASREKQKAKDPAVVKKDNKKDDKVTTPVVEKKDNKVTTPGGEQTNVGSEKDAGGKIITQNGVKGQTINGSFVPL